MKLLLLLVAIYSLIFYQHYKIEKSKILVPGSEPKAGKSYQDYRPVKQSDYENANYLIRNHYSATPDYEIARYGFYE